MILDLGSRNFGHLGLLLSSPEYSSINMVPYICSVHPGKITIPDFTAQHGAVFLTDEYNKLPLLQRNDGHGKWKIFETKKDYEKQI